jgi:hypothetical protein
MVVVVVAVVVAVVVFVVVVAPGFACCAGYFAIDGGWSECVLCARRIQVDPSTGALRKDAVAANLAALENATSRPGKLVALNFWPGPMVGFDRNQSSPNYGLPAFAPGDQANKVPTSGTQADIYLWWQAQQLK